MVLVQKPWQFLCCVYPYEMVTKFLLNFVFQSQSGMNAQAVQEQEVTLLQSVFRAHLKRSTLTIDR